MSCTYSPAVSTVGPLVLHCFPLFLVNWNDVPNDGPPKRLLRFFTVQRLHIFPPSGQAIDSFSFLFKYAKTSVDVQSSPFSSSLEKWSSFHILKYLSKTFTSLS